MSGKYAKQEILDAALNIRILMSTFQDFMTYLDIAPADYIIGFILVDGALIPSITSLDETKNYIRDSVDDCCSKIRGLIGILFNPLFGSASCNLKHHHRLFKLGQ